MRAFHTAMTAMLAQETAQAALAPVAPPRGKIKSSKE